MLRLISKTMFCAALRPQALPSLILAAALACVSAAGMTRGISQDLIVTAGFAGKESVAPKERIELLLNRPLQPSEGRLAVLVGQTDLTNLFIANENGLKYGPNSLPLPVGDTVVTIYLVSPANEWREVTRIPLSVRAPAAPAQPEAQPSPSAQPGQPEQRTPCFHRTGR